jgi:hypothetical protein
MLAGQVGQQAHIFIVGMGPEVEHGAGHVKAHEAVRQAGVSFDFLKLHPILPPNLLALKNNFNGGRVTKRLQNSR